MTWERARGCLFPQVRGRIQRGREGARLGAVACCADAKGFKREACRSLTISRTSTSSSCTPRWTWSTRPPSRRRTCACARREGGRATSVCRRRYLKVVDRFNEHSIYAFAAAGKTRFLLLHEGRNEDTVRSFFVDVYELYVKVRPACTREPPRGTQRVAAASHEPLLPLRHPNTLPGVRSASARPRETLPPPLEGPPQGHCRGPPVRAASAPERHAHASSARSFVVGDTMDSAGMMCRSESPDFVA